MCRRRGEAEAPSTALRGGTVEVFINMRGYMRFSPAVLWQATHQCNELLGGGSRLGLGQRSAQLGDDLVAHRDLDLRAGILPNMAHQLREPFARFTDRQFHEAECTRAYNISQQKLRLGRLMLSVPKN